MSNKNLIQKNNTIDVLKLVLAFFVTIIHSGVDKTVISPALRTAVPLFYIISGYFFFSKMEKLSSAVEKRQALIRLVKRNLLLYLLWTIVQLPVLYVMRGYHQLSILSGVWHVIRDILLGSGFTGAWFIIALAVAVAIVFWLSKKVPAGWLVLLTMPVYILCCLITNYYHLFAADSFVLQISEGYYRFAGVHLYTSFPVALFWVAVGRLLVQWKRNMQTGVLVAAVVVFGALLGLERYWIVTGGFSVTDDCYFMLMLFCPAVFLLVCRNVLPLTTRVPVRQWSTVLYVTHGCCGRLLGYSLKLTPLNITAQNGVKIVLTLFLALLICKVLIYLGEKKHMPILRYMY